MDTVRRDIAFREQRDLFSYQPPAPVVVAAVKPSRDKRTAKVAEILSVLAGGDAVSSNVLHELDRRAAAVVRNMREMGHQIESFNVGEETFYRYTGYEKRVAVSDRMKAAYYETSHWRYISGIRRDIDRFACTQCKSGNQTLNVHHWVYNLFAENPRTDLITFCEPCHTEWHNALTGSRIHFPRFVSEEIAAKLGWKQ
jgi:hypothetical protein